MILIIGSIVSCSSDDGDDGGGSIDCTVIAAGLEATITTSDTNICPGESVDVTITGTPSTTVSYSDGGDSFTTDLDASGSFSFSISPEMTTTYTLENIVTADNCEAALSSSATIEVTIPEVMEQIVGTWDVVSDDDGSDQGTVTFMADGTGTASDPGRFTDYNAFTGEPSAGFNWTVLSNGSISADYFYTNTGGNTLINYAN